MEREEAAILSRAGNWAVAHLPGRKFPGIELQGDTFAILRTQFADATLDLRTPSSDPDVLDGIDNVVEQMDTILAFYEKTLTEQGFKRPY